jgi:hypothetical protein
MVVVFFLLGIVFLPSAWSASIEITDCSVQVKINEIYLSSDGGSTWSSNLISSPSDYITVTQDSPTSIFSYFAQNVQVSSGTYTHVKVVLNPVIKGWFAGIYNDDEEHTTTFWSKENTTPFNQATGQDNSDWQNTTFSEAESGYWYMNLTSGYETITQALNLTIGEGQASTIRVEVQNNFNLILLGHNIYTTDANPSTSTLIVVQ